MKKIKIQIYRGMTLWEWIKWKFGFLDIEKESGEE